MACYRVGRAQGSRTEQQASPEGISEEGDVGFELDRAMKHWNGQHEDHLLKEAWVMCSTVSKEFEPLTFNFDRPASIQFFHLLRQRLF